MTLFADAFAWLADPGNWTGPAGIPAMVGAHLRFTLMSLALAACIGVPAGWAIGHTGRGRGFAVALAGAARALPSLGLLTFLVLVLGVAVKEAAAVLTLVALAVPSILAGAYSGIDAVPRATIDSARGIGMTPWQVLWRVEVPLGLPLLLGGLRAASLQVVSTVAIAAYVGLPNLGTSLIRGLRLGRYEEMLAGALLIAALALVLDGLLALAQRLAVPHGVHVARGTHRPSSGASPGGQVASAPQDALAPPRGHAGASEDRPTSGPPIPTSPATGARITERHSS